jgi:hypothetical protein
VCWKPCSSCRSVHLLREEFLSAPIHSPPLWFAVSVLQTCKYSGTQPENSEACIARIQALTMKERHQRPTCKCTQIRNHARSNREGNRGRTGPKWAWANRPSPLRAQFGAPLALGVRLIIASSSVSHHIEQIILPTPFNRKLPPQDEGESWMSSSQGSTLAEGRKKEEDSKPLA